MAAGSPSPDDSPQPVGGAAAAATPAPVFAAPHISFSEFRKRLQEIADSIEAGLISEEDATAAKAQESRLYFRN
jgi:hypothetical protein